MHEFIPALPTTETEQEGQPAQTWQCPQITRIDIRRTLYEVGSDIDGGLSGTWEL
ncbi:MAG: hypothetical protein JW726_15310 [Anaerolineales bacterium]|nr:hypothetical protein [Anaerolineales bacterium]